MCTECWARNPALCEDVVSLSYAKLSPSVSNTLKLQIKECEIQLHVHVFQTWLSSVLNGLHGTNYTQYLCALTAELIPVLTNHSI